MTPVLLEDDAEQDSDEIHPLLQPPVCRTWFVASHEFRLPWEKKLIDGVDDLELYLSEAGRGLVPIHKRFVLKNLDLGCETVSRFFETHQLHLERLRIQFSCKRLEELFRQMRFPNLQELILEPPVSKYQFAVLTTHGLGPGITSALTKLKLKFTEFTSRTIFSMEVLSRLRFFPALDVLHVTGDLSRTYPIFLHLHPGMRISALYLFGSAMKLPISDFGYFRCLSFLEMDGLHQIQFRGYCARMRSLKTLVLRNEEIEIYQVTSLARIFPQLTTLSVTLLRNRGKSFIPMVFRMENLESLELIGNFTDKMICGKSDPTAQMESRSLGSSIWRKLKKAIREPRPCIFDLKRLKSLKLTSPMLTRTVVFHGLRRCDDLLRLELNMNPNYALDMPAMGVLGQLTSLNEFVLDYPEMLRFSPEDIFHFLKKMKQESENLSESDRRMHDNLLRMYCYNLH